MPHLLFLKRYWRFSSDDLSVPAMCSILYRLLWTSLLLAALTISFTALNQCENEYDGGLLLSYLFISIIVFIAAIISELFIFVISFRGSVINSEERTGMNKFLTAKIGIGIVQLILAIFGSISLGLGSKLPCNESFEGSSLIQAFLYVVVISQFVDAGLLVCCCYLFSTHTSEVDIENSVYVNHSGTVDESELLQIWEQRCRKLTKSLHFFSCNLLGGGNINEGYEGMANVLAAFFHHDGFLDVVPSDVVAGLVLVRFAQQKRRIMESFARESDIEVNISASTSLKSSSSREGLDVRGKSTTLRLRTRYLSSPVQYRNQSTLQDFSEMEVLARCSVFATSAYSHILSVYMQPCTGPCRVCCACLCRPVVAGFTRDACASTCCGNCVQSQIEPCIRGEVVGDNCLGLNRAGVYTLLQRYTLHTELVYASFANDTHRKPFVVVLDHEKETVVLAVRGTLSLEDCVTDVLCDPTELTAAGEAWGFDGSGRFAHGGFLKVAMFIRQEIASNPSLQRIFSSMLPHKNQQYQTSTAVDGLLSSSADLEGMHAPLNQPKSSSSRSHTNYALIVTGHSLGAGVAVLLTWLLRHSGFPAVTCYSYGTPASVLDRNSAEECSSYVTSMVYNNDLICRTSFSSINKLRNDVLDCLAAVKASKFLIFKTALRLAAAQKRLCGTCVSGDNHRDRYTAVHACRDLMFEEGEVPDSKFKTTVLNLKRSVQERAARNVAVCELYIPGRILHFINKPSKGSVHRYEVRNAHMDDMKEIKVSVSMGSDHLPDKYFLASHDVLQSE
mmetsp:Transcript_33425/g.48459  ORF Transcript_33425/g.48459 Transcript_33425/m.48459 type:complete len:787 (+) Transcript_33425:35-2395(+)